ncbi:hypothetical protein OIU78_020868 [Salix suchowensis]|nr:hypothetical protein OIU78_020868 [Salix suchowensis]
MLRCKRVSISRFSAHFTVRVLSLFFNQKLFFVKMLNVFFSRKNNHI